MKKLKPDIINALFNIGGVVSIWFSILTVLHDKAVAGIHWTMLVFFISWSTWNLYFYSHLKQWYSLSAGVLMVSTEITYMSLLIYYG